MAVHSMYTVINKWSLLVCSGDIKRCRTTNSVSSPWTATLRWAVRFKIRRLVGSNCVVGTFCIL